MKQKEVIELSVDELNEKLIACNKELAEMKMSHAVTPIENPLQIRNTRKVIARIKTELTRRKKEQDPGIDPEVTTDDPNTGRGKGSPPKPPKPPTDGFGKSFGDFRKFVRRNPVLSLVGYDALKNLDKAIPTIQGGRASIVQAKS